MGKKGRYLLAALLAILLVGCRASRSGELTMDDVRQLAQKGDDLMWSDFSAYQGEDVGSGLYIRCYPIDESYCVLIGGPSPEEKPMYIRLVQSKAADSYVDIRYDDLDTFLNAQ